MQAIASYGSPPRSRQSPTRTCTWGPSPRSRTRRRVYLPCWAERVTAVTLAPHRLAACTASDPQPQPPADQVKLVALRVSQRAVGAAWPPVRARVRHRRIQEEPVKADGQVVVMGDDLAGTAPGVRPAADPDLAGRRGRQRPDGTEPHRRQHRTRPGGQPGAA